MGGDGWHVRIGGEMSGPTLRIGSWTGSHLKSGKRIECASNRSPTLIVLYWQSSEHAPHPPESNPQYQSRFLPPTRHNSGCPSDIS